MVVGVPGYLESSFIRGANALSTEGTPEEPSKSGHSQDHLHLVPAPRSADPRPPASHSSSRRPSPQHSEPMVSTSDRSTTTRVWPPSMRFSEPGAQLRRGDHVQLPLEADHDGIVGSRLCGNAFMAGSLLRCSARGFPTTSLGGLGRSGADGCHPRPTPAPIVRPAPGARISSRSHSRCTSRRRVVPTQPPPAPGQGAPGAAPSTDDRRRHRRAEPFSVAGLVVYAADGTSAADTASTCRATPAGLQQRPQRPHIEPGSPAVRPACKSGECRIIRPTAPLRGSLGVLPTASRTPRRDPPARCPCRAGWNLAERRARTKPTSHRRGEQEHPVPARRHGRRSPARPPPAAASTALWRLRGCRRGATGGNAGPTRSARKLANSEPKITKARKNFRSCGRT